MNLGFKEAEDPLTNRSVFLYTLFRKNYQ